MCFYVCFVVWKTDTLLSLSLSLSPSLSASSTTSLHCDVQCVCIHIILNDMQIYIYLHIGCFVCNKNKYFFWDCLFLTPSLTHFLCILCVGAQQETQNKKGNKFAVISAIYNPKINFSKLCFFSFCSLTQEAKKKRQWNVCLIDCFFELVTVVSQFSPAWIYFTFLL